MANAYKYQEIWANKLAQRLDKPQNWKEVMDVMYTDNQTTVLPYISTGGEPAIVTSSLTTAAARSTLTNVIVPVDVTMSTETLQIVTTNYDAVYIDYADQAQSNYARIAEMGDLLGKKVNERVETLMMADAANETNFGDTGGGVPGLAASALTVTSSNIDDIIRGIIEQIYTANGFDLYKQNGGFVIWRPQDWTAVTAFMQANGFSSADQALRNGGQIGIDFMGLNHYVSTSHTAGHLFAGVRKLKKLGLLRSTFGQLYTTETPGHADGMMSGTTLHARLDYGFKTQTNVAGLLFDVNVA